MSDVLGWLLWLRARLEAGDNPRLLIKEHQAALQMARAITRSEAGRNDMEREAIDETQALLVYLATVKLSSRSRGKVEGMVNKTIVYLSIAGYDIPF